MAVNTVNNQRLVFSNCITCGVLYAVPEDLWDNQRRAGGYHYCCNGHSQGWSKDGCENEKVRRERDRLRQRLVQRDDEIRALSNQNRAAKGQITKLKKRAAAGTCPCCRRTFQNLSTHMKRQHPEFVEEQGAKVVPIKGRTS